MSFTSRADPIHGIVLAGGRSSRMGRDKAGVEIGGRTLLSRTIERLRPQCGALVVSRHDGTLDSPAHGLPVVADGVPGRAGPLAGILAGLDWVAGVDPAATHAVSVPVDAPFLPSDLVARLAEAREAAGAGACCAASGERRHPAVALWPVAARHRLRTALVGEGLRRLGAFLDGLAPAVARWPVEPFDPFLNLNAPGDLAAAEEIARRLDRA